MIAQIYKIKSSRQLNMKWWHVEKNTKKKKPNKQKNENEWKKRNDSKLDH